MTIKDFYKNIYFWIRLGIVALVIVLAIVLFFTGKQHQFLLDNNTKEANGTTYSSINLVEAQIDDNDVLEIPRRTRLNSYATGQSHTLTVTWTSGGAEQTKSVKFKVPVGEDITLISIPAFISDADESIWKEEFVSQVQTVEETEDIVQDDMAMDIEF